MAKRGTTKKTADRFITKSRRSSPSTKQRKPAKRNPFGSSSQFKGVFVGVPGDPRR